MDDIIEHLFNFIIEAIKFVFYVVIWSYILFYIGFVILKISTLLNYPSGKQLEKHINLISGVGLNGIYITWACIATYNFNSNIYLLVAGGFVALLQILLVSLKYYSQDKSEYEY